MRFAVGCLSRTGHQPGPPEGSPDAHPSRIYRAVVSKEGERCSSLGNADVEQECTRAHHVTNGHAAVGMPAHGQQGDGSAARIRERPWLLLVVCFLLCTGVGLLLAAAGDTSSDELVATPRRKWKGPKLHIPSIPRTEPGIFKGPLGARGDPHVDFAGNVNYRERYMYPAFVFSALSLGLKTSGR